MIGAFGLPISLLLLLAPEPRRPSADPDGAVDAAGLREGLAAALRHLRSHAHLYLPLVLFVSFGAMSNFANSGWVPAILGRSWHVPPQQAGPMLGMIALPCGIVGLLFSGFVLNWLTTHGRDIRSYGMIAAGGVTVGTVGLGLASSLPVALAMFGVAAFFLGTSYAVGASTLGQVTPVRLIGRVTALYFLVQTLLGQALGPFLVAFGSQQVFAGQSALASSFALWSGIFGVGMIVSLSILQRRLKRQIASGPAGVPIPAAR